MAETDADIDGLTLFIQDPEDFPMLAGQISSSCIPLVDVRDVAGNLVHGNFLMSGISLAGLIPYGGDIAKAGSKLSRFVLKNLDNVPEIAKASRFLLENCPDLVKGLSKSDEFVAAMKKLGESDLGRLTKAEREALEEFYEKIGLKGLIKGGKGAKPKIEIDINLQQLGKKWGKTYIWKYV